jgi:hypothetical protein
MAPFLPDFAFTFKLKFAVRKNSTTSKELLLTLFNVNRSINKLPYDEVRLLRLRLRLGEGITVVEKILAQ